VRPAAVHGFHQLESPGPKNRFRLDYRAGMVADLPAFPGGKASFLNHSCHAKTEKGRGRGRRGAKNKEEGIDRRGGIM